MPVQSALLPYCTSGFQAPSQRWDGERIGHQIQLIKHGDSEAGSISTPDAISSGRLMPRDTRRNCASKDSSPGWSRIPRPRYLVVGSTRYIPENHTMAWPATGWKLLKDTESGSRGPQESRAISRGSRYGLPSIFPVNKQFETTGFSTSNHLRCQTL